MCLIVCCLRRPVLALFPLLTILFGFMSPLPPQAALAATIEVFVADDVNRVALAGSTLFWHTGCGGEYAPERSRIRRREIGGGASATLYFPVACAPDAAHTETVAIDSTHVYWIGHDGWLRRLPLGATSADTPELLIQAVAAPPTTPIVTGATFVTLDDQYVYWNVEGGIYRWSKSGGSPLQIASTPGEKAHFLRAAGGGELFYLHYPAGGTGRLTRLFPMTATVYSSTTLATNVEAYAVGSDRIYYAVTATPTQDGAIRSRRRAGSDEETHAFIARAGAPHIGGSGERGRGSQNWSGWAASSTQRSARAAKISSARFSQRRARCPPGAAPQGGPLPPQSLPRATS
jgi:hypothetical protein